PLLASPVSTRVPYTTLFRSALWRQRGGPGFLAEVGHGAEQPGGPLVLAPLGRDPAEVFRQNDRGPVVLHPLERRERDGEPAERALAVALGEREPAPPRGDVRDGLVEAILETEGDPLVERRPCRREVAARLRHDTLPVQRVGDPVPRAHGPRQGDGLRQDA